MIRKVIVHFIVITKHSSFFVVLPEEGVSSLSFHHEEGAIIKNKLNWLKF